MWLGSRSNSSALSFNRLIFPFFLNIPSADKSEKEKKRKEKREGKSGKNKEANI